MSVLILKVPRNMFLMFQQVKECFSRVPPMFRNTRRRTGTRPRRTGTRPICSRNTPNKPVTSRNAKNMFPPYYTVTSTRQGAINP